MARKLRIDDTITIIGNILDQDNHGALNGGIDGFFELSDPDGAITLVDNMNQTADITADAPGEATVVFDASDVFGISVPTGTFAVEVIDAVDFTFALSDPDDLTIGSSSSAAGVLRKLTPSAVAANCACDATAVDEQGLSHADYTAGLTNISWTRTGTAISFDVGGGPVASATGTLSLRLVAISVGDSVVTLSATNASGDTISTEMNVRVMGAVTLEVVEAT